MEEIQEAKKEIRNRVSEKIAVLSDGQLAEKVKFIENRLF